MFSTASKPLVALRSSARDNFSYSNGENAKKPRKLNGFRGFSFLIPLFPFEEI